MKLFYNLDTGVLGAAASATVNLAKMVVKRYHTAEVELVPVRGGAVVTFGPEATGVLAVKTEKDFAGELKILDAAWDAPTAVDRGYVFVFLVAGAGLDSVLGTEATATFGMEITVRDGDRRLVLPTIQLVVENNYYREDEPVPSDPLTPYPLPGELLVEAPEDGKAYVRKDGEWVEAGAFASPDGSVWKLRITNDGVLETIKL